MPRGLRVLALGVALLACGATLRAQAPEADAGPALLAPDRIARLPATQSAMWQRYISESGRLHALDTASMHRELQESGLARMTRAPYEKAEFVLGDLDADYRGAANRGFDGLIRAMVSVDSAGLVTLRGIVAVAGLDGKQNRSGTYDYYVGEPVVANDPKGAGAFILAANELNR